MAFDREIASMTIFCEASGVSQQERIAVAYVLHNRVGEWQPTISGVCLQRMQFSEWNADVVNNRNLLRAANISEHDQIMLQCTAAYNYALDNPNLDPTKGATHYHDKSISPPAWTQNMTKTLETQSFIFYRD